MQSNIVERPLIQNQVHRLGRSLTVLLCLALAPPLALASPNGPPTEVAPPSPPQQTSQAAVPSGQPWQPYKVKRGVSVERRPAPGSKFFEYRAVITTPLAARLVGDLIWRSTTEVASNIVKKRDILRSSATEQVIYDQVRTPVVSDRDYTLLMRKVVDPQRFQVTYETANELGPPVQPKFVRIPVIRGSWTAESDGPGRTRLTYMSYSEPGGSIPAFMVHGAQLDSVVESVLRLQDKLSQLPH